MCTYYTFYLVVTPVIVIAFFSCILVLSLLTAAGSATCGSSHVNTMFGWKTPLSVGIEALDVVQ